MDTTNSVKILTTRALLRTPLLGKFMGTFSSNCCQENKGELSEAGKGGSTAAPEVVEPAGPAIEKVGRFVKPSTLLMYILRM